MKKDPLTGKRVFLRTPHALDCEELIALNRASVAFHRGLASPPKAKSEFDDYLTRSESEDNVCFLVCRSTDKAIVGSINLSQIFRGPLQSAYLGYYVGAQFANQGYMTEAVKLTLRHAFQTLKLHRVEANIQPGNTASIAMVRRAGFTQEGFSKWYLKIGGRWRDHERWAITVENWNKK